MTKAELIDLLHYTPECDFYYDDEDVINRLRDNKSRQDVFKKVKALINNDMVSSVDQISEKDSEFESSKSVKVKIVPGTDNRSADEKDNTRSNALYIPKTDAVSDYDLKIRELEIDKEQVDLQSAMVDFGSDLFDQMTRLDMQPSVINWNSIAKFFLKEKFLEAFVGSAKMSNERAEQKKDQHIPSRQITYSI